jgi:hypothetical protein
MLVDRFAPEGAFARAPEVAEQTDPVLKAVDSFSGQVQRAKPLIRVFFYLPRSMLFNTIDSKGELDRRDINER